MKVSDAPRSTYQAAPGTLVSVAPAPRGRPRRPALRGSPLQRTPLDRAPNTRTSWRAALPDCAFGPTAPTPPGSLATTTGELSSDQDLQLGRPYSRVTITSHAT